MRDIKKAKKKFDQAGNIIEVLCFTGDNLVECVKFCGGSPNVERVTGIEGCEDALLLLMHHSQRLCLPGDFFVRKADGNCYYFTNQGRLRFATHLNLGFCPNPDGTALVKS